MLDSPVQPIDGFLEHRLQLKLRRSAKRWSPASQRRLFVATLVVCDVLMLTAAFALAYLIRFNSGLPLFNQISEFRPLFYTRLSLILLPVWLCLFWAYRLYDWQILLGGTDEYAAVFQACIVGAILIAFTQFVSEELVLARGWVGLTWVLAFVLVVVGRFGLRRVAYFARTHGYLLAPAFILGANNEGRLLGEQLLSWPTSGLNLLGYLDDQARPGVRICGNLHVIGPLDQLGDLVHQYQVEELIITTSAVSHSTVLNIFRDYGTSPRVHLRLSSGLFDLLSTGLHVKEMAYVPLIGVNQVRLAGIDKLLKILLEYGLILLALPFLAPVMLVIAALVKLDSPGPVFYRRRVVGLNGRQFDALKFRTMHINGDEILKNNPELLDELATTHKIKDDPRITGVGRFLRKYSLDELPQFFNVLKADMNLIGPRMISPNELKKYGSWGMNLLTVRPGLTGIWQVSGRSDVSYEERVRLDMFYIRNYSIWLDMQLILRTIPVVLSGKGAY